MARQNFTAGQRAPLLPRPLSRLVASLSPSQACPDATAGEAERPPCRVSNGRSAACAAPRWQVDATLSGAAGTLDLRCPGRQRRASGGRGSNGDACSRTGGGRDVLGHFRRSSRQTSDCQLRAICDATSPFVNCACIAECVAHRQPRARRRGRARRTLAQHGWKETRETSLAPAEARPRRARGNEQPRAGAWPPPPALPGRGTRPPATCHL
jgi:hypothetical protein